MTAGTPERLRLRGRGVSLAADAFGSPGGPPLLFLHGSGQTRQSWARAVAEVARRGYRAISLDLRGHGDSDWSPDGRYEIALFAEDLRQLLDQLPPSPVIVGASLGGLAAMLVAAEIPERLRGLVLVDITARIEREGAQEVIAFMGSAADGFASIEDASDAVAAYLPHRPRPSRARGLERNLRQRGGRWYWHWDPAFMKMGENAAARATLPSALEDAARRLTLPVLLVRGGESRIVSEQSAREFRALVPQAQFVDVAGAHHMIAGEANDAFNDAMFGFVDSLAVPGPSPAPARP